MGCLIIGFLIIFAALLPYLAPELVRPLFTIAGIILGIIVVIFIVSKVLSEIIDAWNSMISIRHYKLYQRHCELVKKAETEGNLQELIKETKSTVDMRIRLEAIQAIKRLRNSQGLKSQIVVGPLIGALMDKEERVREIAAVVLGEIGDEQAIKSLLGALQNDRALSVLLACYSALKQISKNLEIKDTTQLVQSAAIEIRRLYSRTRTVYEEYTPEVSYYEIPNTEYIPVGEESDPDTESIRSLIVLIPEELHDKVQALSGEAGYLFLE